MTPKQKILLSKIPQFVIDRLGLIIPDTSPEEIKNQAISRRVDDLLKEFAQTKHTARIIITTESEIKSLYVDGNTSPWNRQYIPQIDEHGEIVCPF